MAPLPKDRVQAFDPPFTHTGLDYFGPVSVKVGRAIAKRWILLLTCMATRAVHLEVVHAMDNSSLLMAIQRFIDRRGKPAMMRSDNGTSFVSGSKQLERTRILNDDNFTRGMTDKSIEWMFNPPHAPHFGGVWERLVRSAKNALLVALRDESVTDEVLHTVIVDVEALMNSRPLTHISVTPDEPEPLTPNHFLFGRASPYVTMIPKEEICITSREQIKIVQITVDRFWKRWMWEYLPHLTERKKWLVHRRNIQLGDLALVIDDTTHRGKWPVGQIVAVEYSADGVVRSAKVQVKGTIYSRPVSRICLLATPDDGDNAHEIE